VWIFTIPENPQQGRCGRRLLMDLRPPSVTPWVPHPSGFERLAAFESQQVDGGRLRDDRHSVIKDRVVCRNAPYGCPSLGRGQNADVLSVTERRKSPWRSAVKKHRVSTLANRRLLFSLGPLTFGINLPRAPIYPLIIIGYGSQMRPEYRPFALEHDAQVLQVRTFRAGRPPPLGV